MPPKRKPKRSNPSLSPSRGGSKKKSKAPGGNARKQGDLISVHPELRPKPPRSLFLRGGEEEHITCLSFGLRTAFVEHKSVLCHGCQQHSDLFLENGWNLQTLLTRKRNKKNTCVQPWRTSHDESNVGTHVNHRSSFLNFFDYKADPSLLPRKPNPTKKPPQTLPNEPPLLLRQSVEAGAVESDPIVEPITRGSRPNHF